MRRGFVGTSAGRVDTFVPKMNSLDLKPLENYHHSPQDEFEGIPPHDLLSIVRRDNYPSKSSIHHL
jgi:hypothetical protein